MGDVVTQVGLFDEPAAKMSTKFIDRFDLNLEPGETAAVMSSCQRYRYRLIRRWGPGPLLPIIMLNPSTADEWNNDQTVKRCLYFVERIGGYGGFVIVNLMSWRATLTTDIPADRATAVGPDNEKHLLDVMKDQASVLCAWGGSGERFGRDHEVMALLRKQGVQALCLGVTQDGHPRHPSRLPNSAVLVPFLLAPEEP